MCTFIARALTTAYGTKPTTSALQRYRLLSGALLTSRDIAVLCRPGARNSMYALHVL